MDKQTREALEKCKSYFMQNRHGSAYELLELIDKALQSEVSEQEKSAMMDVVKYGQSFMLNSKHIPLEKIYEQKPISFDVYCEPNSDYWYESSTDIDLVDGKVLGEEFELYCNYDSVRLSFKVTKVPDDVDDEYEIECINRDKAPYLYTHPTEFKTLTDDEVSALFVDDPKYISGRKLARAIEQALKEKNKVTEQ